jgi:hypothetical protein
MTPSLKRISGPAFVYTHRRPSMLISMSGGSLGSRPAQIVAFLPSTSEGSRLFSSTSLLLSAPILDPACAVGSSTVHARHATISQTLTISHATSSIIPCALYLRGRNVSNIAISFVGISSVPNSIILSLSCIAYASHLQTSSVQCTGHGNLAEHTCRDLQCLCFTSTRKLLLCYGRGNHQTLVAGLIVRIPT